jgi:uncharacterized protein (UPF0333 family)
MLKLMTVATEVKIVNVDGNKTKIANDEISKFQKVAMIKDEDQ